MNRLDPYEISYLSTALLFQLILVVYFALRKGRFDFAIRNGWIFYALSVPAAILSTFLLSAGKNWSVWLGGYTYLAWAGFGYTIEYIMQIEWRNSLRLPILAPFVALYLATVMFYWWPVALLFKPLWYVNAALFCVSTYLNLTSHRKPGLPQLVI